RERGMRVELGAYGSRVLLDWREVARDMRPWDELERTLDGNPVADLEDALWDLAVAPAGQAVVDALRGPLAGDVAALHPRFSRALDTLLAETHRLLSLTADPAPERERLRARSGAGSDRKSTRLNS